MLGERTVTAVVPAVAAVFQILTLRWTWDLWFERSDPPNLPVLDGLAEVGWGWLLVLACIATVIRPRWGGPAFCVLFALAALGDQMRLQPGVVSLAILMTAPAFGASGRSIARWHLCSLWIWAGIHKLLSPRWDDEGAAFIAQSLDRPGLRTTVAVLLPLFEIGLGVVALWPRTWRVAAVGGVLLHVGIFMTLSPVYGNWNSSVWPWNLACAVAAPLLFWPPRDESEEEKEAQPFPTQPAMVGGVALLAFPALFYAGVVDAYLSHNLYTSNTASAQICIDGSLCNGGLFNTFDDLNVPMPPEPRLFRQWFDMICDDGDVLQVQGRHTRLTDPPSVSRDACV